MKVMHIAGLVLVLGWWIGSLASQVEKTEGIVVKPAQNLFVLQHTKIGKKLDQMWGQVWGGEREKQRREKYRTPEDYAHRPLDTDEKELIAEMLEFAKGRRYYDRLLYPDEREAILRLLRRVKHVSMIDGLVSILWDMPPELQEAIARWKEIEKGLEQIEREIDELVAKGLSREEASKQVHERWTKEIQRRIEQRERETSELVAKGVDPEKAIEQVRKQWIVRLLQHPLTFTSEIRVMEEAVAVLASIADDRTMDDLLRLLDQPLEPIVMTTVTAVGALRGDRQFLLVG